MQFRTEIRSCVDNSSSPAGSGYNACWAPAERIVRSDADVIAAQMVASQRACLGIRQYGGKEDLKKAYRQSGRPRELVRLIELL